MFGLALSDADAELIHLAAIDGKTGASARHSSTRRYAALNRAYRALRSRVSALRYPHFIELGAATTLPARASGEDYIEIDRPAEYREVCGVDVRGSYTGSLWARLDGLDQSQRRAGNTRMPTHGGVGFWSTIVAPAASTTALTDGKIAVWPYTLTGEYRLVFVQSWTSITTTTHVFPLEDGWEDWLLCRAAMLVVTRDSNKRSAYDDIKDMWAQADALIAANAAPDRAGGYEPTPYVGIEL